MLQTKSYKNTFAVLIAALIIVSLLNISLGSVYVPFKQILAIFLNNEVENDYWNTIILTIRLPKAITAIIVGSGLSISGLLMQTIFRNPLAGPFVLGISSGASLGVAILILGASFLGANIMLYSYTNWGMAVAASIGSFFVLASIMVAAVKVRNTMSILIIGLMFGSLTSAVISILAYFSSAAQLQQFMFWSFGSLGSLSWIEILTLFILFSIGLLLVVFIIKPLNGLLIGENYARSLGINVKRTRNITLIATSILTGVITAFSGPIAFIGLAVPHITKLLFSTSNHKTLIPAVAINGAIIMLICDSISQLPTSEYTLPINAITSIFGAPIIIWLLVRKRKIHY